MPPLAVDFIELSADQPVLVVDFLIIPSRTNLILVLPALND